MGHQFGCVSSCIVSNKSLQDQNSGSVDTGDLQRTSAATPVNPPSRAATPVNSIDRLRKTNKPGVQNNQEVWNICSHFVLETCETPLLS